jgi:hypothetical protein
MVMGKKFSLLYPIIGVPTDNTVMYPHLYITVPEGYREITASLNMHVMNLKVL